MQEFQKRVVDEKTELDLKISKLESFLDTELFRSLDRDEQVRMTQQYVVMKRYSEILQSRINHF